MLAEVPKMNWLKTLSPNNWNQMRFKAQGNLIQIWLNGFKTVHYTEKNPQIKYHETDVSDFQYIVDLQPNAGIEIFG